MRLMALTMRVMTDFMVLPNNNDYTVSDPNGNHPCRRRLRLAGKTGQA